MTAYLYTWNPKNWNWSDLSDAISHFKKNNEYKTYWSCGNTKKIKANDLFFLMRLGLEPKGIVGFGEIISNPYPLPHWDEKKIAQGKTALRTSISFKKISKTPIISIVKLKEIAPTYNWTPEVGGLTIPEDVYQKLINFIELTEENFPQENENTEDKFFIEGSTTRATITTYDRSPLARKACIQYYGYNCSACNFNFLRNMGN